MGKFSKKCKKNKAPQMPALKKAEAKANSIDKETSDRVIGEQDKLNTSLTLVTMVHLNYIMHSEYGFGAKRFERLNSWIEWYSDAVKEKRFDYDSLKKEVVIAVDPEIKGIGWKDYKPMRKVEPFGANQDMPKSYKELKDRMIIHKRRIFIDEVFAALELLIATTLFDCYDWGLKRIERVITLLREARSWDIGKFFCILQYLSEHKCMDFKNRDIKDLMACRRNMGGLMA